MHVRKRNGRWQGRLRSADGTERTRTFDRKIDAEKWAKAEESAIQRGEWVDPRSTAVTFAERAEVWQSTRPNHKESTRQATERRLRLHVLPKWGHRAIGSIQRSEIQAWVAELTGQMAPGTVRVVVSNFQSVMAEAELDQVIARNPSRRIRLPSVHKRAVMPFSETEAAIMLEVAGDRWRGLWAFAIGSGLRSGELRAVTSSPDSLDWTGRQVHVHRQWSQDQKRVVNHLKTEAGRRTVPLAEWVLVELAEHCRRSDVGPGDWLFTTETGKPIRSGQLAYHMKRITTEAGIVRADGEPIHFHDCRHTYASTLIRANLNPKQISRYLGHASIVETFDTYGHLFEDDDEAAREALNRFQPSPRSDVSRSGRGLRSV